MKLLARVWCLVFLSRLRSSNLPCPVYKSSFWIQKEVAYETSVNRRRICMAAVITFRQKLISGIGENPRNELLMEISSSSSRGSGGICCIRRPAAARRFRCQRGCAAVACQKALSATSAPDRQGPASLPAEDIASAVSAAIYKSLFTENSVATQKQYSTSVNTNKIQRSSPSHHHQRSC